MKNKGDLVRVLNRDRDRIWAKNLLLYMFFSMVILSFVLIVSYNTQREGKQKPVIPQPFIFKYQDYTDLSVYVNDKIGEENRDLCYDLIYLPDESKVDGFVRDYYSYQSTDFFGKKYEGLYGYSRFNVLYRTNGDDKIIISFYDGTNETYSLSRHFQITINLVNSNKMQVTYGCYFDHKLRASNLTYEQLKDYVCDDWKRECER